MTLRARWGGLNEATRLAARVEGGLGGAHAPHVKSLSLTTACGAAMARVASGQFITSVPACATSRSSCSSCVRVTPSSSEEVGLDFRFPPYRF